jgi:phage shock protein A
MPPPDRFAFDLHTAYPDVVIDTMRQAAVAAIDDLADHVDRLRDSFLLAQTAADFAQSALAAVTQLQAAVAGHDSAIAALRTDLDALTARVTALEPAPPPAPT